MNISILDCTLRDGGYINDWNFSNQQVSNIISSLESSSIDIIECGYLNNKKGKSQDSTLFENISVVDNLLKSFNNDVQKVVMINYGDYDIETLPEKNSTLVDGIRLAFHKEDWSSVLATAKKIIDLGYKLYFQPMVTKNYRDIEFLQLIDEVNRLGVYAFYIVDSFGSMTLNEFNKYLVLSDNNLNKDIALGYHSHNNMQLAFSNAINMCNSNLNRDIIIDSSIYGIGRGAGNLNTELIIDYINGTFESDYKTLPLLETIDEFLSSLMKKNPWGFSPAQYLSASFNCHPNYATFLINKNTNHIVGVRRVLEKLSDDKKSSFDKEHIEKLYIESLLEVKSKKHCDIVLSVEQKIMLIASGKSIETYEKSIIKKVDVENYITISLNFVPNFECDYYFFSNQKRFDEYYEYLNMDKTIITNNIYTVRKVGAVLDFHKFVYLEKMFCPNVAIIIMNFLRAKGFKSLAIAGLDGFDINTLANYAYSHKRTSTDIKNITEKNKLISQGIEYLRNEIDIEFITPSLFDFNKEGRT